MIWKIMINWEYDMDYWGLFVVECKSEILNYNNEYKRLIYLDVKVILSVVLVWFVKLEFVFRNFLVGLIIKIFWLIEG